jgi:long-chain acyl-CoA synthetase
MKRKSNKIDIQNVREMLEKRAADAPDKIFLFSEADARRWSYSEFNKAVNRAANMLVENKIKKGDVVSLLMPNSAEYIIAYFACWKIGALAGPVNSLLKAEEIEFALNNSEAKMLLVHSQFLPVIEQISKSQVPSPKSQDGNDLTLDLELWTWDLSLPHLQSVILFDDEAKVTKDFSENLAEISIEKDDEAIIIYTSGTTGKPKGCLLTHQNLIANARQITEWLGFGENDRLLTIMPLFHMNAVSVTTMTALYAGASTVVSPKFSASKFWQIISDYKITSFGSVATMLSMLLAKEEEVSKNSKFKIQNSKLENENPKSKIQNPKSETLRFAMCGSAPVPAEVLKKFEETFDCLVIEGYGLSESTCRSTFNPPNTNRRAGSCGQPIGNEMKIFDESDEEVKNGELGEIVLRGENIFKGYFKNDEATKKAFQNGWFHTGDIGFRDDEGFFYIADRKSDMIIRGGENIYPREIDELLFSHPSIASAAVIGVPDDLYGEEVAAFVVLKDGEKASEEDLINFCKTHLADYKCPKTFHFVEDIPKGPTGKLLKRELSRIYSEKLKVKSEK